MIPLSHNSGDINNVTMSDNSGSESGSDDLRYNNSKHMNGKGEDSICRDFLRNVCKRGKRCRYRHPTIHEAKDLGKRQDLTFCHDFQNTGCHRANCKFLHCSREEEEFYLQTSQLPNRLQQQGGMGVGAAAHSLPILKGEVPICKDYLKRECKRGVKCKYRHLTGQEYEYEIRKGEMRTQRSQPYNNFENDAFDRYDYAQVPQKRRRVEPDGYPNFEGRFAPPIRPLSMQMLEEENSMLRRKVDELKKQVADLTATNEVLLEQNARYRISKTAAPINHLNTSLSQQIALNSEMATQHALQTAQRIAREIVHQPNQSALAAQSINPSVTLNPSSIVSLTPASLQQNPLQGAGTITQSIPQNMAGQSTTLVSYPIVSQSMRVAGVSSSLSH